MDQTPTTEALATFDLLIAYLRNNKSIIQNYNIYGMCECNNNLSPGRILYDEINRSSLPHIFGHVVSVSSIAHCHCCSKSFACFFKPNELLWNL